MDIQTLGRGFVLLGLLVVVLGVLLMFFDKIPFLGKLPGDIHIRRENFQVFIPITTSIVLSIIVTLLLWGITHFKGK